MTNLDLFPPLPCSALFALFALGLNNSYVYRYNLGAWYLRANGVEWRVRETAEGGVEVAEFEEYPF